MPAKNVVKTTPVRVRPEGALEKRDGNPSSLLAMAIQNGADPAVLERFMDMQERWEAGQARKAYVEAMSAFKRDVPSVLPKDALVDFSSAKGRTRYKHATLGGIVNQITTAMSKHGLAASWETAQDGGVITVSCHITHSAGHRESVTLCGPPDDSGNKNPIQQIGSTVTYLQRYTLMAALGLASAGQDDADDRPPVERPTVTAPPVPAPGAPTPRAAPPPPPPDEPPAGAETVEGTIEDVTSRPGQTGKKKWTVYKITIGGEVYSTFDQAMAEAAGSAWEAGDRVCLTYHVNAKGYRDLDDLVILRGPGGEAPDGDAEQDKLPF